MHSLYFLRDQEIFPCLKWENVTYSVSVVCDFETNFLDLGREVEHFF